MPDGNYTVRQLTPRECCRLQTYDERCFEVAPQISNTQWYKCFGNGWTVDVIVYILEACREIESELKKKPLFPADEVEIKQNILF